MVRDRRVLLLLLPLLQLLGVPVDNCSRMGAIQEPLDFQTIPHSVRGAMLAAHRTRYLGKARPTTCSATYQQLARLHACELVRWCPSAIRYF